MMANIITSRIGEIRDHLEEAQRIHGAIECKVYDLNEARSDYDEDVTEDNLVVSIVDTESLSDGVVLWLYRNPSLERLGADENHWYLLVIRDGDGEAICEIEYFDH